MRPATAACDARWGCRQRAARRYGRRRYGGGIRRLNHRLLERALGRALAGLAPGALVLDAPCGTGILGPFLARRGLRVIGADISPAMLAVARERDGAVGHVRADLELPPLRPRSVDAVVCTRFLMHLPAASRPRVLDTLAGLGRGPLVATVCHPYTLKSLVRGRGARDGRRAVGRLDRPARGRRAARRRPEALRGQGRAPRRRQRARRHRARARGP